MDPRRNLLAKVKVQAEFAYKNRDLTPKSAWSQEQWWTAFTALFGYSQVDPASPQSQHHSPQDDLWFFVCDRGHTADDGLPFFVRRKNRSFPPDLEVEGSKFNTVNWAQSVLLNLVLQSMYQLTVVACSQDLLPFVAEGRTWQQNMKAITKTVYASPTFISVGMDSHRSEAANPSSSYPDLCFAVENFDEAFEDLVLHHPSECYCVVLHVVVEESTGRLPHPPAPPDLHTLAARLKGLHTGDPRHVRHLSAPMALGSTADVTGQGHDSPVALNNPNASVPSTPASPASVQSPTTWQISTRRRTLFAGFVSHEQIVDFIRAHNHQSLVETFFGGGAGGQKASKVVMSGPGGIGRAEVAVTRLPQASETSYGPGPSSSNPQELEKPSGILGWGMARARQVLNKAKAEVQHAAMEVRSCPRIQCALMLLQLPVDYLVKEILEAL